ncbi:MAG: signal peptidase I [Microthrixaceae bacterium]|nr:signal peptidase I [Microthrixaceae bacterium]
MSATTPIRETPNATNDAGTTRRHGAPDGGSTPVGGAFRAAVLLAWMYLTAQLCLLAWVMVPAVALGWEPHVITSGSMAPKIRVGEVVLSARPSERTLETGTIVVFEDPRRDEPLTHRVVGQESDGSYRTQGDANPTPDPRPVPPEDIRGVGRLLVPMVGLPVVWLRTGALGPFALWAALGTACIVIAPGRSVAKRLPRRRTHA